MWAVSTFHASVGLACNVHSNKCCIQARIQDQAVRFLRLSTLVCTSEGMPAQNEGRGRDSTRLPVGPVVAVSGTGRLKNRRSPGPL